MALIDEYKQAIQDVLDGRAKPAPKPSELPWSEDKAATMWAAAAAELIAEANGGDALPATPGSNGTYALQNTVSGGTGTLSWASGGGGGSDNILVVPLSYISEQGGDAYYELDASYADISAALAAGKPVFAVGTGMQMNCTGCDDLVDYNAYFVGTDNSGLKKFTFGAEDTTSNLVCYPS